MLKSLSLTQFFQEKLVSILSEYLKDFSTENISQLSLGLDSALEMRNLDIKEDLLIKQSIPFVINHGKIGKITIKIPVSYKRVPMSIEIENITIHIRPLVEQRNYEGKQRKLNKNEEESKQESAPMIKSHKEKKLLEWEKKVKKYFQASILFLVLAVGIVFLALRLFP